VRVRLTRVATVTQPTSLAVRPGDPGLWVTEKTGRVLRIQDGSVQTVLDVSGEVSGGFEQGLLGLAFSPDGRLVYLDYTDRAGDTRVVEVELVSGRRRELLFVDQPFANHNGGQLVVRPDGTLWIALGDGGSGGDPLGNAQNLGTLLGKIVRIDPRPDGDRPYRVPADNPFVGRAGVRPEIWDYGLRNPWRFSFDRATGDLWIGDVGQGAWEEVDFEPAGAGGRNYGWNLMEGSHPYRGGRPPPGAVPPLFDYARTGGNCAVTGGYVYRGGRIPGLTGAYVYGDFCAGRLLAVRQRDGRVTERADLGARASQLSSFGEDHAGELYALSLDGPVWRIDP
jgi:glucose/arabinose dehydrogenase